MEVGSGGCIYLRLFFFGYILGFFCFPQPLSFLFLFTVHICSLSVLFFLLYRPSIYLFRSTVFVNFRNACLGRSLDFRANFSRRIWLTIIQPIGQHSWSLKIGYSMSTKLIRHSIPSRETHLVPRHIPFPQPLYTQHTPYSPDQSCDTRC